MFIRAYVGSRGKGSYKFKHEALISSGSYLLNDEKGNQEKAPISCCVFVSGDGGRAHNKRCQINTTKKTHFLALKPTLSIRWFLIARNPPTHSESKLCDNKNHMINRYYPLVHIKLPSFSCLGRAILGLYKKTILV